MDLQAEKLKDFLVKTIRKNSAILWLIGTTFAAFMIYVGILTFLFVYMLNPESGECFSPVCAEIIFFRKCSDSVVSAACHFTLEKNLHQ